MVLCDVLVPSCPPWSYRIVLAVACVVLAGCTESAGGREAGGSAALPPTTEPAAAAWSEPEWGPGATAGAVVYVPVYSHIYTQDATRKIDLAATLSVRNTDPARSLTVASVAYYDTDGRLVREHLDGPLALGPLGTRSFVVEERDPLGGSGANFLVTWSSDGPVSEPIVQAVMISTASAQGLSFVGEGHAVRRLRDAGGLRPEAP